MTTQARSSDSIRTTRHQVPPVRLLTVRAAADALGLGVPTVRRWIGERRLAVVRVGTRAIRVPESEVARVIDEGMIPARRGAA